MGVFKNKLILKIAGCISFFIALVIAPYFAALNILNYKAFQPPVIKNNIVLELWHIETFEGGSINRGGWLQSRAVDFKKKNNNINILVVNVAPEQMILNLQSGRMPDAISFGVGVGEHLINALSPLSNNYNVFENFKKAGQLNEVQYAVPFLTGAYCVIGVQDYMTRAGLGEAQDLVSKINSGGFVNRGKSIQSVSVGLNGFINPQGSINTKIQGVDFNFTSYQAYENFVYGNSTFLLGTTRDYVRCKQREESGKMNGLVYEWQTEYTDLVQYLAAFNGTSGENLEAFGLFLEYILSDKAQQSILDMDLFGVNKANVVDLSQSRTINAFTSVNNIEANKRK
ncbi:MAG: hypothetical protein FWD32_02215 [Firmicutes bacterium]|nr:hypothetical protein [Bacillota bacterium]